MTIPDKTTGKTPDGLDEMPTQSKIVLPGATNTVSQDETKTIRKKPKLMQTSLNRVIPQMKSLVKLCSKRRPLLSEDQRTHVHLSVVYALLEPQP